MSLSAPIISNIIISSITFFFIFSSLLIFYEYYELSKYLVEYEELKAERFQVDLRIMLNGISDHQINLTLRNCGNIPIFFFRRDYCWSSFIVSYKDESNIWRSYLIEDFQIISIKIVNANFTSSSPNSLTLYPGEEAEIMLSLPSSSPKIPVNSLVEVAFTSNYGVSTMVRGVRSS